MKIHALLFSILLTILASTSAHSAVSAADKKTAASQTHTPAKGSTERKEILDALRVVIRKMSGLEVVFVVPYLKVNQNWAWVEAEPQSADGKQRYETLTGLLNRKNGRWIYVEGPPEFAVCEEDPDCIDTARYFKKLSRKYPATAPDIFPK
jgi:hypothetical protein